jgi:hypothetical protein
MPESFRLTGATKPLPSISADGGPLPKTRTVEGGMNYRRLLLKYMQHVRSMTLTSYVPSNGTTEFSPREMDALRSIHRLTVRQEPDEALDFTKPPPWGPSPRLR